MGKILAGSGAGCGEGCSIYALAPWTPYEDHVVRPCTCGFVWQFDARAAADIDAQVPGERDSPLPSSDIVHPQSPVADVAWFVMENLAWEAISFGAGYGWHRVRRRAQPGRPISNAEATHAAVQRILSAHSTVRADELMPLHMLQVGHGAVEVTVLRGDRAWEVLVKPSKTGLLLAAIVMSPGDLD